VDCRDNPEPPEGPEPRLDRGGPACRRFQYILQALEEAHFVTHPTGQIDIAELPDLSHDNIKVEVERCIAALSRIGLEPIFVDVTHPKLEIPAFYTIVPGAHFRERATGTSVGMFSAKLIAGSGNPEWAVQKLREVDGMMPGKYYVKFFDEALLLDPKREDVASIYSYMGICLKDQGEYRKAIAVLEKAEESDNERTTT